MILTKAKTLHYLRTRKSPVTVRLPDGKPIPFPADEISMVVAQDLAVGVGNERRLSYVSLRFFSRVSHGDSVTIKRGRPSLSSEDSRTWLEWAPGHYEPHREHCEAFSPESKGAFY